MKTIGIIILAAGVGICAAFGARLSDGMYDRTRLDGQIALLQGQIDKAWADYCQAREAAKLAKGECAPPEEAEKPAETPLEAAEDGAEATAEDKAKAKAEAAELPTLDEALAAEKAALAKVGPTTESLSGAPKQARDRWLALRTQTVEPKARVASMALPGPEARLSGWFSLSGMPFLGGLALIVIGAMLGRRAAKAELSDDDKSGNDTRVDFGVAVENLAKEVRALSDRANALTNPSPAERKAIHGEIEDLQLTRFGPIVEARYQLQNRIGLGGFANVFGPFSGGERWVNRAWSTLADDHWPETVNSLSRSADQLATAAAALREELAKAS